MVREEKYGGGRVKYALGRLVSRAVSKAVTRKSQELPIDEIIGKNTDEVIKINNRQLNGFSKGGKVYKALRKRKAEGGLADEENTRQSFRDTAFRMKILGESLRKEDYVKNHQDIRSYRFIQQQAELASRMPYYTSNEREVAEQWSTVGPTREYTPEELKQKEQYTNKYLMPRNRKAEGGSTDEENTRQSFGDAAFRMHLRGVELRNKNIKADSAEASRDRKMVGLLRTLEYKAQLKVDNPYFTKNDRKELEKYQRLVGPSKEFTPEQLQQKEQYTNEYLTPRNRKAEGGSTDDELVAGTDFTRKELNRRTTLFNMAHKEAFKRWNDGVDSGDINPIKDSQSGFMRTQKMVLQRELFKDYDDYPEGEYVFKRDRKAEGGYTTESGTLEPEEAIRFTMKTYFPEDKPHVVDYLINQAQVESRLGEDKNTYNIRTSSYLDGSTMRGGFGIHQIDEIAFEDVKNRLIGGEGVPSGIKKYGEMVKDVFDKEDLKDIEYEDLRDPVNNTIFSRLIHKTKPDPIPEDIEGQAKYWTDNYNKSAIPKIAERREISVQKVMDSMGSNPEIQKAVDDFRKELNEKFIERLNKNSGGKVIRSLHKRVASL